MKGGLTFGVAAAAAALLPAASTGAAGLPVAAGTALVGNGTSLGVAIDGSTALVGQGATSSTTNTTPQVAVYSNGSGGWTQVATLTSPAASPGAFGHAVALDAAAQTAAVGTGSEIDVYTGSGATWTLQQAIAAPADLVGPGGGFGGAIGTVAVSGSTLVVGDNTEGSTAAGAGAAWVYTRSGGVWSESAKLTGVAGGDGFGNSVGIDGGELIVGAPLGNGTLGAAYVYSGSGSAWSLQATLGDPSNPLGNQFREFGWGVAIRGGTVVVGEPNVILPDCVTSRCDIGTAWVFAHGSGPASWLPQSQLTSIGFQDGGENFGDSVAVDGSDIVVGSPGAAGQSFAYVFDTTSTATGPWVAAEELAPPTCDFSCNFGQSVDVSGGVEIVAVGDQDARVTP